MSKAAYGRTIVVVWLVVVGVGGTSVVVVWCVVVVEVTAGSEEQATHSASVAAHKDKRRREAFFILNFLEMFPFGQITKIGEEMAV